VQFPLRVGGAAAAAAAAAAAQLSKQLSGSRIHSGAFNFHSFTQHAAMGDGHKSGVDFEGDGTLK
jgi:hypothetical protein